MVQTCRKDAAYIGTIRQQKLMARLNEFNDSVMNLYLKLITYEIVTEKVQTVK